MTCMACGQPYGCNHSDAEYQGVAPPARRPFWATCHDCGHKWAAGHYPIPEQDFVRLDGPAVCPACSDAMEVRYA